jgi:hypothetical protein
VSDLLFRVTNALDGFCSAAAEMQSYGGCCDRYSYLCPAVSRELNAVDAVQLSTIPFDLPTRLLGGLKQVAVDLGNTQALDVCTVCAGEILKNVVSGRDTEQFDVASQRDVLHYCALAVQFLCLSFTSYCQAHLGTLRFFFLDHEVRAAHLTGAPEGVSTGPYPTIEVGMQRLTCLETMLNNWVVVFRPSSELSGNIQPPRPDHR